MMKHTATVFLMTLLCPAVSFVSTTSHCSTGWWSQQRPLLQRRAAARYGPTDNDSDKEQEEWERMDAIRVKRQEVEFRELVQQVISTTDPSHLPGTMTRHMDLLLTMRGYEGTDLMKQVIEEADSKEEKQQVMAAIDYILSFMEEFVEQTQSLDSTNKQLLGKIIRQMMDKGDATTDREQLLDELLQKEKPNFTAGFLRHVEGECERIALAPKMTPESSRLLETLRVIQTRVLEELGKVNQHDVAFDGQGGSYNEQHFATHFSSLYILL